MLPLPVIALPSLWDQKFIPISSGNWRGWSTNMEFSLSSFWASVSISRPYCSAVFICFSIPCSVLHTIKPFDLVVKKTVDVCYFIETVFFAWTERVPSLVSARWKKANKSAKLKLSRISPLISHEINCVDCVFTNQFLIDVHGCFIARERAKLLVHSV